MPAPPRQRLGLILAPRRHALGRSIRSVAAAAGIGGNHLALIECAQTAPSYPGIGAGADALGRAVAAAVADEQARRAVDGDRGAALAARGAGAEAITEVLGLRPATLAARSAALQLGTARTAE